MNDPRVKPIGLKESEGGYRSNLEALGYGTKTATKMARKQVLLRDLHEAGTLAQVKAVVERMITKE